MIVNGAESVSCNTNISIVLFFSSVRIAVFFNLKELFERINILFYGADDSVVEVLETLSPVLKQFLTNQNLSEKLNEIRKNTATYTSFQKRFYSWFDGFMVVKYLNVAHQYFYEKIPVVQALNIFFKKIDYHTNNHSSSELLEEFRELDRKGRKLTG